MNMLNFRNFLKRKLNENPLSFKVLSSLEDLFSSLIKSKTVIIKKRIQTKKSAFIELVWENKIDIEMNEMSIKEWLLKYVPELRDFTKLEVEFSNSDYDIDIKVKWSE